MAQVFHHRNGGGLIVGISPAVGNDCFIDSTSLVEGRSRVSWASYLRDNSAILNSEVVVSTLDRTVAIDSHIAHSQVMDSVLKSAIIRGTERPAEVSHCVLSGGVVIEGCKVSNLELDGPYFIHSDWDHTPRHRLLRTSNGVVQGLIECSEDNDAFHSGCEHRDFAHWDKNEHLLRRHFVGQLGWPLDSFNSIRTTFEQWRRERRK